MLNSISTMKNLIKFKAGPTIATSSTILFPDNVFGWTLNNLTQTKNAAGLFVYNYVYSGNATIYYNGTYEFCSSSMDYTGDEPWRLYQASANLTSGSTFWQQGASSVVQYINGIAPSNIVGAYSGATNVPYQSANGANNLYTGGGSSENNFSTLYNGSSTVNGEWIQIKFPFKIILSSLSPMIRYPSNGVSRAPSQYYILGSNNGTTWFLLNIGVNTSPPGRGTYYPNTTFTALNQTPFNYIRVVITKIYLASIPNAYQGNVAIATIQMTGTASA